MWDELYWCTFPFLLFAPSARCKQRREIWLCKYDTVFSVVIRWLLWQPRDLLFNHCLYQIETCTGPWLVSSGQWSYSNIKTENMTASAPSPCCVGKRTRYCSGEGVRDSAHRFSVRSPISTPPTVGVLEQDAPIAYSRGHQHSARGHQVARKDHMRGPQACSKDSTTHQWAAIIMQ